MNAFLGCILTAVPLHSLYNSWYIHELKRHGQIFGKIYDFSIMQGLGFNGDTVPLLPSRSGREARYRRPYRKFDLAISSHTYMYVLYCCQLFVLSTIPDFPTLLRAYGTAWLNRAVDTRRFSLQLPSAWE